MLNILDKYTHLIRPTKNQQIITFLDNKIIQTWN